jgi:hypothetical protein
MKILKGEALQLVLPEEVAHCTAKAIGISSRQGQNLGQVPGLGESESLQGSSPWRSIERRWVAHSKRTLSTPAVTKSQEAATVSAKDGVITTL